MAISVKDIQEKEFSTQTSNGYNVEEVDDFLDALSEQLAATARENLALNDRARALEAELAAANAAKAELENRTPSYDEGNYFKNLESAMRESLIGAQRIADEAVVEANKKAKQTLDDANALAEQTLADAEDKAKATVEDAERRAANANAEVDRLRGVIDAYCANFKKLVAEQTAALNANEALLK